MPTLRSIFTTCGGEVLGLVSREELLGVGLELFEEDAVAGDLGLDVAVGGAGDADADGARGGVAGQADDADVVGEVLAAELGADAELLGELEDASSPGRGRGRPWPQAEPLGGEGVEVARRWRA